MSRASKRAKAAGAKSSKAGAKVGLSGLVVRRVVGDDYVRMAAFAVARSGWRSWRKAFGKRPEELYSVTLGQQGDVHLRTDKPAGKKARTKAVKQELEAAYRQDLERS